jgi:hypothetical protein
MTNVVLLTGAGFSKNWGGSTAREITNALMSQLKNNRDLLTALNQKNFEDVLSEVQSQYLAAKTADNQNRLNMMQAALASVFGRMNDHFVVTQFEFSDDVAHSIKRFLVRFDQFSRLIKTCSSRCTTTIGTWRSSTAHVGRDMSCRACANYLWKIHLLVGCGPSGCRRINSPKRLTCSRTSSFTAPQHGAPQTAVRSWWWGATRLA